MAGRRWDSTVRREVATATVTAPGEPTARRQTRARRETANDPRKAGRGVKELAGLMRALADETRLRMLALLRANPELCVCDIAAVLDLTHSKASRHLRYLAVRDLVTESRRRTWAFYRWNADATGDAAAALRAVRPFLMDERFAALQDRLRAWNSRKARDGVECEPPAIRSATRRARRTATASRDISREARS